MGMFSQIIVKKIIEKYPWGYDFKILFVPLQLDENLLVRDSNRTTCSLFRLTSQFLEYYRIGMVDSG